MREEGRSLIKPEPAPGNRAGGQRKAKTMSNWEQDIMEYTDGLLEKQKNCLWRRYSDEKEFRIQYATGNKEVVVTIPRQVEGKLDAEGGEDIAYCSSVEVVEWNGKKVNESCSLFYSTTADFGIGYDGIDLGPRITRVLEILLDIVDGAMPIVEDWATADKRLQAEWDKAAEAGDRETLMGLREKLEENELRR